DYPPWDRKSWFDWDTYQGSCKFTSFWDDKKGAKESIEIYIQDHQFYTLWASCPKTATRPSFLVSYGDHSSLNWYSTGESWEDNQPMVVFRGGPPKNTGRDPLRVLNYEGEDYSVQDFCSTVKRAVQNLWTFKDLCNEFHQEYDEAVKTANREVWQKKEDKVANNTYYTPPRK
ncbi:hypothetical protein FOZ63_023796, partial [Perkinsus olseni]